MRATLLQPNTGKLWGAILGKARESGHRQGAPQLQAQGDDPAHWAAATAVFLRQRGHDGRWARASSAPPFSTLADGTGCSALLLGKVPLGGQSTPRLFRARQLTWRCTPCVFSFFGVLARVFPNSTFVSFTGSWLAFFLFRSLFFITRLSQGGTLRSRASRHSLIRSFLSQGPVALFASFVQS
jgi:hypothetical protein